MVGQTESRWLCSVVKCGNLRQCSGDPAIVLSYTYTYTHTHTRTYTHMRTGTKTGNRIDFPEQCCLLPPSGSIVNNAGVETGGVLIRRH